MTYNKVICYSVFKFSKINLKNILPLLLKYPLHYTFQQQICSIQSFLHQ